MAKRKGHGPGPGTAVTSERLREIYVSGGIDDDVAREFMQGFRELDSTRGPITLVMCSPGGDEAAGWAIHDHLVLAANEVNVLAYSECQSIAALILQGGRRRLLSPSCRFMMHNGSMELDTSIDRLHGRAAEALLLTQKYWEAIAARSGLKVEEVRRMCGEERYLDAQKAVALGLADGIILPSPTPRKR